ncbi:MAG TPA: copper chaperone PCu(A)C [Candidatus Kryptobacter bacterium]|nr:copper chaperone PCu(A)C [Candidatus Kryptobacter bacterium]
MTALFISMLMFLSGNQPGLAIKNASVGVAAKGMSSAAFFRIVNNSGAADTLYGVKAEFAEMAQLHESFRKDGMVGMRPVKFVVIPAKSSFYFKHGGYHVMLMNVKENLKPGCKVKLELLFRRAGVITVEATVKH